MKKQRLSKWAHCGILLAMCVCFAACSTEKNVESRQDLLDVGSDEMQITLVEEGFADDVTTATRAVAQSIPAGTVDLGDGLEAEVSLTEDAPSTTHGATTRTIPISDGHYNIVAYDDATNKLVTGVNKQLSGNFVGGIFQRDPGKRLVLASGTYKFVCYTDGIYLNPTYGTGSLPSTGINKKKEMVGMTRKTISDGGEPITFLMHHRTNRFRFRFTAYTEQLTNVKASLVINYSTSNPYYYLTIPTGFQGPGTAITGTFQSDECTLSSARQATQAAALVCMFSTHSTFAKIRF